MKYIPLTQNQFAIVDDQDFDLISQYKWYAHKERKNPNKYYPKSTQLNNGVREHLTIYSLIMNPPKGYIVDHINGNPLDNRRDNLRICTPKENNRNMPKSKDPASSIYKGVSLVKNTGRWYASIKCDGKSYNLGCYDTEFEAAQIYDKKATELFGEFAKTNFPNIYRKAG